MAKTTHPIRFGLQTGQQLVEWSALLDLWQRADDWGYDSLWAFDHFYPIFVDPKGPCLEGWTLVAALAQATLRARVGHLVSGNTYRNPCVLGKMAATVDHVSGGRLNLGIGAGWFELEHRSFGIDFKTVPERLEALEESLQILKGLFTQEKATFRGRHYTVTDAMCLPAPLQKPHPPIMIGGTGRKVLLRIVAQYADMWNAAGSPDEMAELIGVIERHAERIGRDHTAIEKTVMLPLCYRAPKDREEFVCQLVAQMRQTTPARARAAIMIGSQQECIDTVERFALAGVTHFIFMLFTPYFREDLEAFAEEVVPHFRNT
jgi:F420-dependent oxidoreductase-like protein